MNERSVEETLLFVLKRDHGVDMVAADLDTLKPSDVGLDSLSEAELFVEVSDLLGIYHIDSLENSNSFRDIVVHFQDRRSE